MRRFSPLIPFESPGHCLLKEYRIGGYYGNSIMPSVEAPLRKYGSVGRALTRNPLVPGNACNAARIDPFRRKKGAKEGIGVETDVDPIALMLVSLHYTGAEGLAASRGRIKETYPGFWHLRPDFIVNQTSPGS